MTLQTSRKSPIYNVTIFAMSCALFLPSPTKAEDRISGITPAAEKRHEYMLTENRRAPNIVLILLDDAGYAATSTFGGAAQTPALDRLAASGLKYNRFHVTALCSPTRAALLSGRNAHRIGFGTVMELAKNISGYDGVWRKDSASIADVLRRNGYSTAAIGKWHNTPFGELGPTGPFDRWPTSLGFEYFYGFLNGESSQWEPLLFRNTSVVKFTKTPAQGYHFTTDIVDEAIRWVHTHQALASDRPYFLYLAPGATHAPHQVPKEWIARYRGKFDGGWDKLRSQIFARQKRLEIIPANTKLTPRPSEIPAWDKLSDNERTLFSRQMEVYAAFISHTDHEIGRLLDVVRQGPEGDNTLVLYIAGDNGGSADDGLSGLRWQEHFRSLQDRLQHLDDLGGPSENNGYAAGWAWATSAPFQWMKRVASHLGGTRDPLIVSWPARITDHGALRTAFTHVVDIAATIYDVAGIHFPAVLDGVPQKSLDGISFVATFASDVHNTDHRKQYFEQMGNRAIYNDGWIAGARHGVPWELCKNNDYDKDKWELYHITDDFSEARDLSAIYPNKLKALMLDFDEQARKNRVYPIGAGTPCLSEASTGYSSESLRPTDYLFYPDTPSVSAKAAPDFQHSFRIIADVFIPEEGAKGILVSLGDRSAGFVLYVSNDRLVYENNLSSGSEVILSDVMIPRGHVKLSFDFDYKRGRGRLFVNDSIAAERNDIHPVLQGSGSFDIGQDLRFPIHVFPDSHNGFTGDIESIRIVTHIIR